MSANAKTEEPAAGSALRSRTTGDRFQHLLLQHAPAEDTGAYDKPALKEAAALAWQALKGHRKGDSIISIDGRQVVRQDRPVTVVTVVNDNMPFLFDSVLAEITEQAGEPLLVVHPVFAVKHGKTGVTTLLEEKDAGEEHDRVSVIHVHVAALSDRDAGALEKKLSAILAQVKSAVQDWRPMLARLDQAIGEYRYSDTTLKKETVAETVAFLEWLRDDNFTFLGMREYRYTGGAKSGSMERADKPGLGILKDPNVRVLRRGKETVVTTPEIRAFLTGPDPLIVTKANVKSVIHRRIYLDYIGIKTFDEKGKLKGELRIVGLFTSTAYTRSVMTIPYLRFKVKAVVAGSGFDPADHSGKALINVLESYPRDELFQIDVPLLRKNAEIIVALGERPRVRVLVRTDPFDRFVSAIVYVPRDNYDSHIRERIGDYLRTVFDGHVSAYYPAFPEGSLTRVHFIIGRTSGPTPVVPVQTLEAAIRDIVRTWEDALRQAAAENGVDSHLVAIARKFPGSYRDSFPASEALRDAARIRKTDAAHPIDVDFRRRDDLPVNMAVLKIYHHGAAVALSRRVPILEHMGFRVISERTFEIPVEDGSTIFLHDMELESADGGEIRLQDAGMLFTEVFLSVWSGASDNDGYNALAYRAGLTAADIMILRAYGRYLQQAGIPQSQDYIAAVLARHAEITRDLHRLFVARFDPKGAQKAEGPAIVAEIEKALEDVPNLDEDTILRRFLNLVHSTLRTNHFMPVPEDEPRSLALKLDSTTVEGLPSPRPWREIFVYGPEVEGVHLRFGPVARGGIRWSDRAQDYRTEILGLVKAQQVKNACIVPVGAKGGFYPKRLPSGDRDAIFEAGRHAYINFISSLLSVTDNLHGAKVVPPKDVVRHDGDDPYFVVAADKGTATFSDTANAISQTHQFWLDDAFASGGSAGYDHKKIGITARGAWEAVKRHFREMDRDIQSEPFTVTGVGDMSGDVFGNGMLLSEKIRLIAAFDHRDIFIDPDPDTALSFAERRRLFDLPRSSWQSYDKTKISEGGGIYPRTLKSIKLSTQAAAAIGLDRTTATPSEIMSAILKAPVDLLWFGGIGTYIRASSESNADAGDRSNDAIRITAAEVRAKVVGEGANLGVTQRARIEYGLLGGRCNSDAIDNSGGVNCSDVEVNIKIGLAAAMRAKKLSRENRNALLVDMTDNVAALVLANNYQQTLALSMAERRGIADLAVQRRFMHGLEERHLLNRKVEFLPDEKALRERETKNEPLTRAELGVLLAYGKLALFQDFVASGLPDDPYLEEDLFRYFPRRMAEEFAPEIAGHRLRREIIATELVNDLVNRGGPAFVARLQDLTGQTAAAVGAAFVIVRDGFELNRHYAGIDALDAKIDGHVQLDLYAEVWRLLQNTATWFLKNSVGAALSVEITQLREARAALEPRLLELMPAFMREAHEERLHRFRKLGAPDALAQELALLPFSELVPDIALVARTAKADLDRAAHVFFAVTDFFRIGRIDEAARTIQTNDYYDGLALARAADTIGQARRGIAVSALRRFGKEADPLAAWIDAGGERVARTREKLLTLTESGDASVSRLSVASGLVADLTLAS
ncbi:MAG TPA: NAD-glutamate dehydrogenase [Rhizobiaceae bacterium]|nr:NAD-glutamate dehydrogenase [Rhizobiaceae bacterium]